MRKLRSVEAFLRKDADIAASDTYFDGNVRWLKASAMYESRRRYHREFPYAIFLRAITEARNASGGARFRISNDNDGCEWVTLESFYARR